MNLFLERHGRSLQTLNIKTYELSVLKNSFKYCFGLEHLGVNVLDGDNYFYKNLPIDLSEFRKVFCDESLFPPKLSRVSIGRRSYLIKEIIPRKLV